jgi:hypothetical protein
MQSALSSNNGLNAKRIELSQQNLIAKRKGLKDQFMHIWAN